MINPTKKRKRDLDETSLSLVEVYNDLADENEETRLKAAQTLLEKFSDQSNTTAEQISTALKRLIRGLCSSRKAARIGFSITLTEFLSQVFEFSEAHRGLTASQVVEVLRTQTAPLDTVSKQDERDHYLGRLFGAEALLKSGILFRSSASSALKELLDGICDLGTKKPWLRQECGWMLFGCIAGLSPVESGVVEDILSSLRTHKLIRTPEGVAIWLAVGQRFPDAKFPKDVWQQDNPLCKKEKILLAKVMRDATPKSEEEGKEQQAQGSAMWNASLHFAWSPVLQALFSDTDESGQPKKSKLISFETFWAEVVDESLFAQSSSSERKHTGFLVTIAAMNNAPPPLLRFVLKGNLLRTLTNQLASGERLLHRAAQRTIQAILARGSQSAEASVIILRALVNNTEGSASFDQITKTKTIDKLVTNVKPEALGPMTEVLSEFVQKPGTVDEKVAHAKRVNASDYLTNLFGQSLAGDGVEEFQQTSRANIIKLLLKLSYFTPIQEKASEQQAVWPPLSTSTRQAMQARLSSCLERAMRSHIAATESLDIAVAEIRRIERKSKDLKPTIDMDDGVRSALDTAWIALSSLQKPKQQSSPYLQALKLLFSLSILQVYNGEPDAVQILEELQTYIQDGADSGLKDSADDIIEILLSFSSQPSKFLRRTVLQVFQNFAPAITASGLLSLTRILEADESIKGQQELFDAQPSDVEEGSEDESEDEDDSELGSDVEMLDSDVEEVSEAEASSGSEAAEDGESDGEDAELAAFDAKLAAALGTRKGEDDLEASDSSGSDEDMNDDEMEALDEQLANVFRARKEVTNKKKENKNAKGSIIQFKNRVLDLLEAYLKQEYLNPLSLTAVMPLLETARKTKTKQISDRSCQIIREYCSKCKGKNVPMPTGVSAATDLIASVHEEVSYQSSQAHASACSQASILASKVLVAVDTEQVILAVDAYATLRKKQLTDKKCHVPPSFFTDWNNWCTTARQQLAT